jgi:hypothetical protein
MGFAGLRKPTDRERVVADALSDTEPRLATLSGDRGKADRIDRLNREYSRGPASA